MFFQQRSARALEALVNYIIFDVVFMFLILNLTPLQGDLLNGRVPPGLKPRAETRCPFGTIASAPCLSRVVPP
jgi:hypothetical protein